MKIKNKIRFIFCSLSLLMGLVLFSQKQSPSACLELLNNNQFEKAMKCAQDMTKNTNSKNELAILFNIQGKALMSMQKPNAKNKFEESNRILNVNNIQDEALQNENENFIRMLTMMQNKNNQEQEDLQSKMLNSTVNNPVKTGKNLGLEIVTNENKKLNEKLKNEKQVQEVLKNQKDSLFYANKDIQSQLTEKSSALDEMTQEQLKQQIILQEQAQLLTNITYQDSIKDIQVKLQDAQIKAVDTQKKYFAIISIALGLLLIGSIYTIYKATQNAKILKVKNDLIATEKNELMIYCTIFFLKQ